MKMDEPNLHRIIRTAFESTDDYIAGFERAVKDVMLELGVSGVEARSIVMRLRRTDN